MLKSILQLVLGLLYLSTLHTRLAALFPCHRLVLLRQLTKFTRRLWFTHRARRIIYAGFILQVHGWCSPWLLGSRPLWSCPGLLNSQHLFLAGDRVLRCSLKIFDAQLAARLLDQTLLSSSSLFGDRWCLQLGPLLVILLVLLGNDVGECFHLVLLLAHVIIVYRQRWLLENYYAVVCKVLTQFLRVWFIILRITQRVEIVGECVIERSICHHVVARYFLRYIDSNLG